MIAQVLQDPHQQPAHVAGGGADDVVQAADAGRIVERVGSAAEELWQHAGRAHLLLANGMVASATRRVTNSSMLSSAARTVAHGARL